MRVGAGKIKLTLLLLGRYVPMVGTSFHVQTSSFHMAGTVLTCIDWFCELCQICFARNNTSCLRDKGSTKPTLCGIILFKLNTFFSHVCACP
jgi:hypothetical protein